VNLLGQVLPAVNASLNATSAVLLFLAVRAVRCRDVLRHRRLRLAAVTVSALFLVGYVVSFVWGPHTRYPAHDWTRVVYFAILISHEILAPFVVPLVLRMVYLGLKNRAAAHKRLARYALPVWGYISVTGVLIYLFSRHIGPWRAG
jgi:putative membrane protein